MRGGNERQEAALFCVSGTMTNQLALRSVMHPMESVLVDSRSHLYLYEVGGVAYHRCVDGATIVRRARALFSNQ